MRINEGLEFKKQNPCSFYKVQVRLASNIYKVERKSDKKIYAMKRIAAGNLNEVELDKLKNELVAFTLVESEFSVCYIEAFYFKDTYFIITELSAQGKVSALGEQAKNLDHTNSVFLTRKKETNRTSHS